MKSNLVIEKNHWGFVSVKVNGKWICKDVLQCVALEYINLYVIGK